MTGGLSLRTRLLAGMIVVVGALAVVAFAVASLTRAHLVDQVDSQLAGAARTREINEMVRRPQPAGAGVFSSFYEATMDGSGRVREVYGPTRFSDDDDRPAITVRAVERSLTTRQALTVGSADGGDTSWRLQAVRAPGRSGEVAVIALPLDDVEETVQRLILVEVVGTMAVVGVLGAVSWWVIRLGIRPVKQMTATAATIAAGDLSQRVPDLPPSTEAGQLGLALNHMLEQLEGAFEERARAQVRLQQFVADASHELRTPVTTIRGYAELYRLGGLAAASELSEAMRRTEQEAIRMSRLVDDMLTLAKLDQDRPLDRRAVDLRQLVTDAAADAGAVSPDRPITVDAPEPVSVFGDEDRLRQVLANIVGNALTHTPAGTPIEMNLRADGGTAIVEVADHGPGMTPEVAARVTERFYRADPARARHRGGSGLGLAIVDAAVAAHAGTVTVLSSPGQGTTVRVTLPRPTSFPPPQVGA